MKMRYLLQSLRCAIEDRSTDTVRALCQELRQSARSPLALGFLDLANGVEVRYASGEYARALELVQA